MTHSCPTRRSADLLQQVEHQVAPLEGALRMTPRVVGGRSLNHTHQQRHLVQLELGQRLAEEELAGQVETVNRPLTILADEDFVRSEEHTSELQSLMRISYAVFC